MRRKFREWWCSIRYGHTLKSAKRADPNPWHCYRCGANMDYLRECDCEGKYPSRYAAQVLERAKEMQAIGESLPDDAGAPWME